MDMVERLKKDRTYVGKLTLKMMAVTDAMARVSDDDVIAKIAPAVEAVNSAIEKLIEAIKDAGVEIDPRKGGPVV